MAAAAPSIHPPGGPTVREVSPTPFLVSTHKSPDPSLQECFVPLEVSFSSSLSGTIMGGLGNALRIRWCGRALPHIAHRVWLKLELAKGGAEDVGMALILAPGYRPLCHDQRPHTGFLTIPCSSRSRWRDLRSGWAYSGRLPLRGGPESLPDFARLQERAPLAWLHHHHGTGRVAADRGRRPAQQHA